MAELDHSEEAQSSVYLIHHEMQNVLVDLGASVEGVELSAHLFQSLHSR